MGLRFRNVDADPADPVATWPAEAIRAALERGGLAHWHRLAAEVESDPWGPLARAVAAEVEIDPPYGVGPLMADVLARARERAAQRERAEVAAQVTRLVADSGLSQAEFAARIGTSASRLSTYVRATVTPSASMLVRMRRVSRGRPSSARRSR